MSKTVHYFLRGDLTTYPPCVTQIQDLRACQLNVHVYATAAHPGIVAALEQAGIAVTLLGPRRRAGGRAGAVLDLVEFRLAAVRAAQLDGPPDIVWFGSADTAIALWGWGRESARVATSLELYDQNPRYRKSLARVLPSMDAVVASELTRAQVMRLWYELQDQPFVMPNRPGDQVGIVEGPLPDEVVRAAETVASHRTLLYQGMVAEDRCFVDLARAVGDLGDDWRVCLAGPVRGDALARVQAANGRALYLGHFPAPFHLAITRQARIGIAYYEPSSLNNILCAPNKIYEYAAFGVPVLGNNVAGLITTVGASGAGRCVDFSDTSATLEALAAIDADHASYSTASRSFYATADTRSVTRNVLARAFTRRFGTC